MAGGRPSQASKRRTAPEDIPFAIYEGFGRLVGPLLSFLHGRRVAQGKEDPGRRDERFGIASHARPEGSLVWVHAASVGETNAILPVVRGLVELGHAVVLTTGTITSAEAVRDRLPPGAVHQFVPYDARPGIERFLNHWRPELAVVVESEIWPATIRCLERKGIPFVIANGRMSPKSAAGWLKVPRLARHLFAGVDLCLARSEEDAGNYRRVGVNNVEIAGNLKFDGSLPEADPQALEGFKAAIGGRPVWFAASTHPGEEEQVIAAHKMIAVDHTRLLTLIAPRHPARGDAVRSIIEEAGLAVAQRSRNEPLSGDTDIYLADTIGEMGLFYRLAPVVFMGASLMPLGGHNPLEPAQCGAAILTGPSFPDQKDVYDRLIAERGAVVVNGPDELAREVSHLIHEPEDASKRGAAAERVALEGKGAVKRTLEALRPFLRRTEAEHR
ncbi:3-deoxy-D-manno-octulosonic acid transferase [Stappia sp. GBMRC 2046]|uniref:3-deoxy-D-manno-octulosonic acid transferase n=1 Tax=Stappia sediminis TaxID=2692190 RepID=A0A7X3LW21_9HYPH|nr:3-deoxy-D-manno-octulosonic acid transferase [Stappia sediminis]MXN66127.1 3-deoxy-D-manno-octulosonic acid transferase [Stappia sediminis]